MTRSIEKSRIRTKVDELTNSSHSESKTDPQYVKMTVASRFATILLVLLFGGARLVSGIIGGSVADPSRYPYFTGYIVTRNVTGSKRMHSGILIAPDVVLANAWYMSDYGGGVLSIKAWVNKTSIKKSRFEYERNVRFWMLHPEYSDETWDHNIALLFLDGPITEVPLAKLNRKSSVPRTGQSLTELGFGVTNDNPYEYPEHLMEVTVDTVPFDVCDKAASPPPVFEDRSFCAGSVRHGSCWYDEGGPMLDLSGGRSADADKDVLVGIIDSSTLETSTIGTDDERCLMPGYPGYFTKVSFYADCRLDRLQCSRTLAVP